MDRIEIRIHKEITNVVERFYGFTFRQWIFAIATGVVVIPSFLFLTDLIGSDLAGWIVIFEALPICFIGFIPVQEMPAERVFPFLCRHYLKFYKPLEYKTEKQLLLEKNEKSRKGKKQKKDKKEKQDIKEEVDVNTSVKKISRKEKKQQRKEEHKQRKIAKQEQKYQRELAKAKRHYGTVSLEQEKQLLKKQEQQLRNGLDISDIQAVIRLGKQLEQKMEEGYYEKAEEQQSESTENDKAK